jgi:hypothetical protein
LKGIYSGFNRVENYPEEYPDSGLGTSLQKTTPNPISDGTNFSLEIALPSSSKRSYTEQPTLPNTVERNNTQQGAPSTMIGSTYRGTTTNIFNSGNTKEPVPRKKREMSSILSKMRRK